jgi:type IV pilus assembly protein PilO
MISRLLLFFARIPFFLWPLVAFVWCYTIYNSWQELEYKPLEQEEITLRTQVTNLTAQNAEAEKFDKERDVKLKLISDLGAKFNQTAAKIPRSPNVPLLLKSLADISDRTGLIFSSFKPQPMQTDEFLTITPMDMTLKGTYPQILSFLDATAHIERILTLRELELSGAKRRGTGSILEAKAKLFTYYITGNLDGGASK